MESLWKVIDFVCECLGSREIGCSGKELRIVEASREVRPFFSPSFTSHTQATIRRLPFLSAPFLQPTSRPQQAVNIIYGLLQEESTVQLHDHKSFSMNAKIQRQQS
jgi:hypothetical protein